MGTDADALSEIAEVLRKHGYTVLDKEPTVEDIEKAVGVLREHDYTVLGKDSEEDVRAAAEEMDFNDLVEVLTERRCELTDVAEFMINLNPSTEAVEMLCREVGVPIADESLGFLPEDPVIVLAVEAATNPNFMQVADALRRLRVELACRNIHNRMQLDLMRVG